MKTALKQAPMLALIVALGGGIARAQDGGPKPGHSHEKSEGHGGTVTMTRDFHFEVAFHRDQVHVWVYDGKQAPIDPRGVEGQVEVRFEAATNRQPLDARLSYVAGEGGKPGHLEGALDLTNVPEGQAEATFHLEKLPGSGERQVTFREHFKLARLVEYVCPMRCVPSQAEPGKCARCKMALVASKSIYACPHHPNVTSRDPSATCWECKMALERRVDGQAHGQDGHGQDGHGQDGRGQGGHGQGGHGRGGHGHSGHDH